MFELPPPTEPLAIIVPCEEDCRVILEEGPSKHPYDAGGDETGSSAPRPRQTVYLRGLANARDFLSLTWKVLWSLGDSEELWAAASELGVLEMGSEGPFSIAALRRRFLFKPCPLLEQRIEQIEREVTQRRCSGDPRAKVPSQLRLRCLEPGCGSGRNLAWLAARESQVALSGGTCVDVRWDVVGLDSWSVLFQPASSHLLQLLLSHDLSRFGALVRMQDLCDFVSFPTSQASKQVPVHFSLIAHLYFTAPTTL